MREWNRLQLEPAITYYYTQNTLFLLELQGVSIC